MLCDLRGLSGIGWASWTVLQPAQAPPDFCAGCYQNLTENPHVGGSTPSPGTKRCLGTDNGIPVWMKVPSARRDGRGWMLTSCRRPASKGRRRPGRLTAAVLIGFWFVIQLISGIGSITSAAQSGVAYFEHIRGFVAGFVVVKFFGARRAPDAGRG